MFVRYLIAFCGVLILWWSSPIRGRDPTGAAVMAVFYAVIFFGALLFYQFIIEPRLARNKRGRLPLIVAYAAEGRTKEIETLITQGVSIDMPGPNGETALMMTCRNNQLQTAVFLLGHGADLTKKTKKGHDAADIAKLHGNAEIEKLLLDATAKGSRGGLVE